MPQYARPLIIQDLDCKSISLVYKNIEFSLIMTNFVWDDKSILIPAPLLFFAFFLLLIF
jgi:hypothetical protein